jgi:hypothetical protein
MHGSSTGTLERPGTTFSLGSIGQLYWPHFDFAQIRAIFLLPKSFFTGGGEKNMLLLLMALKCA